MHAYKSFNMKISHNFESIENILIILSKKQPHFVVTHKQNHDKFNVIWISLSASRVAEVKGKALLHSPLPFTFHFVTG